MFDLKLMRKTVSKGPGCRSDRYHSDVFYSATLAGDADWLCHRASHIETKSGAKESLLMRLPGKRSKEHPLRRAERGLRRLSQDVVSSNSPARRSKRCSRSRI